MSYSISDCNFYGVKLDGEALESVNNVSKALLNLTELFKSQNINIECMLKIEQPTKIHDELQKSNIKKKEKIAKGKK